MRKLLFFAFATVVLAGVLFPLLYVTYSRSLPDLSSAERVKVALAHTVEAERMAHLNVASQGVVADFEVPPFEALPRGMVVGLLAAEACPEFLEVQKEAGVPLLVRVFGRTLDGRGGEVGPGRCQFRFADLIAESAGIVSPAHAAIAIHRIMETLNQKELVAYRLAATWYGSGVVGIESASKVLFGKPAAKLDFAESAELLVAEGNFDEMRTCKNPSRLKLFRDNVLSLMETYGGITEAEASRARSKALTCTRRP